ncbi:arginine/lysine/ornithine decarboxylase [Micromonospora sp. A202]|uniref:aminotransferase class I/II-fold pyridoxal phosphate-dependent enzyme n=1 Tax=Micromonospora sp. A202 TaxID=2572899 RepID=UPI00114EC09D|nr:ornithine decarboxylase [Micromonospora sp. A202]TQJ20077.1 arginine/lysine/ornithine decarboxylase [Micromonospora sp. A202]
MDQSSAPILEALVAYRERGDINYTPPGHKQGRGVDERVLAVLGRDLFAADVMTNNGLDDRLQTHEVLATAQRLMADAVGAEHAFFSTCGSSLSVKTLMISVAGPEEKLLINRNAHKSVVSGIIIAGIQPVWIEPRWDEELHLTYPPGADTVAETLSGHVDAKGVLVVTPTDYGTCADLAAITDVCHQQGKPFLVDEAWGAHLPFHPDLPQWAMDAGADACVTSVHKMGSGLEQSSVFHLQGERIDPSVLSQREDMLGTTSSSPLIYAALDGWRRQMAEHGHDLLTAALALAHETREAIDALPGLTVLGERLLGPQRAADTDPLKIVIDVSELGISGYQAVDWLHNERHINLALADHRRMTLALTHADSHETTGPLLDGLRALTEAADRLPRAKPVTLPTPKELRLELAMLPRDAFFGRAEQVPAEQAVGRVAAEMLTPYPPGVPAVLPGEVINEAVVEYLRTGLAAGMTIPDAADAELKTVRVHAG